MRTLPVLLRTARSGSAPTNPCRERSISIASEQASSSSSKGVERNRVMMTRARTGPGRGPTETGSASLASTASLDLGKKDSGPVPRHSPPRRAVPPPPANEPYSFSAGQQASRTLPPAPAQTAPRDPLMAGEPLLLVITWRRRTAPLPPRTAQSLCRSIGLRLVTKMIATRAQGWCAARLPVAGGPGPAPVRPAGTSHWRYGSLSDHLTVRVACRTPFGSGSSLGVG